MTRPPYPEVDEGDHYQCFDCGAIQIATASRDDMIEEAEADGVAATAEALGPDWEIVVVCDDCHRKRRDKGVS